MAWLRRLLAVLLALVLFLFAAVAVNQEQISLKFLAWQSPSLSVFWWLLISLLLGLLLGLVAAAGVAARQLMRKRRLSKELENAREEVRRLRDQQAVSPPH